MAQPTNDGNIVKRTSQYIDNESFDETTGVRGVAIYGTPDGSSVYRLKIDADGAIATTGGSSSGAAKATDAYSIQAISDDGTYKYFFYEDADANWYVLRKTLATSLFLYTKGTGGYASVYVDSTHGPSGSPTFASYGSTF